MQERKIGEIKSKTNWSLGTSKKKRKEAKLSKVAEGELNCGDRQVIVDCIKVVWVLSGNMLKVTMTMNQGSVSLLKYMCPFIHYVQCADADMIIGIVCVFSFIRCHIVLYRGEMWLRAWVFKQWFSRLDKRGWCVSLVHIVDCYYTVGSYIAYRPETITFMIRCIILFWISWKKLALCSKIMHYSHNKVK